MSESDKITSVEKTKNPKKVEAGKKLGAISRQAKERKASEVKQVQEEQEDDSVVEFSTLAAVFAAAAVVGIIALQYSSSRTPKEPSKEPSKEDKPTPKKELATARSRLDSLD